MTPFYVNILTSSSNCFICRRSVPRQVRLLWSNFRDDKLTRFPNETGREDSLLWLREQNLKRRIKAFIIRLNKEKSLLVCTVRSKPFPIISHVIHIYLFCSLFFFIPFCSCFFSSLLALFFVTYIFLQVSHTAHYSPLVFMASFFCT